MTSQTNFHWLRPVGTYNYLMFGYLFTAKVLDQTVQHRCNADKKLPDWLTQKLSNLTLYPDI